MTQKNYGKIYLGALILVFAGLALLRADLVTGACTSTLASLAAGQGPRLKVIFEIVLFAFILFLTIRAIPLAADPVTDCLTVLVTSFFGFLAELWGTQSGLWTYYTGEKPPYWIVPAWALGVLVVERLARRAGEQPGGVFAKLRSDNFYRAWVLLFYCVFVPFIATKLSAPACVLPILLTAAVLFPGKKHRTRYTRILFTGTVCVFFADLWGTTNHCWTYHTQTASFGTAYGILFGCVFDSAVVLAGIKTAEYLMQISGRTPAGQ